MRAVIDNKLTSPSAADNIRGALFMLCGMFVFSVVDAQAKYLTAEMPPMQIVWGRQIGLFLGVVCLICLKGGAVLKTHHPRLQIARGIAAAMSATLFIIGLSYVPLADAVSVTFISPLVVTILGFALLGERVGVHRWTATIIGFLGTLIVLRPGFETFHPGLLLPLIAACFFAGRQVISRIIGTSDKTQTTVAYTAITSFFLLSLMIPFIWVPIKTYHLLAVFLSMSLLAALGEILVIKALEIGLAVVVSPLHYTIIIWASFYGYVFFDQLPDRWTVIGAAIIMASGLYVLYRERLAAR